MANDFISREAAMRAIIDKQRDHTTPCRLAYEMGKKHAADEYVDVLKSVPAADVVEVVRCGECVRAVPSSNDLPMSFCTWQKTNHTNDFFCANGKRRTDDGN